MTTADMGFVVAPQVSGRARWLAGCDLWTWTTRAQTRTRS